MMTHTYSVSGMTCGGCRDKVEKALLAVPGVSHVSVSLENNEAEVQMKHHINTATLNEAVAAKGNYSLADKAGGPITARTTTIDYEEQPITIKTYWPLILVFLYILGGVGIGQLVGGLSWMMAMSTFMGLFFLVFSFFKLLDLDGFAISYSSYDVVAQKWLGYGYIYPFIELALGIAYLTDFNPLITNSVTLVVMAVSTIGVVKSIIRKSKFQCACLGTVFNLPMSTVTLVEDSVMLAMAAVMLIVLI